MIKSRFLFSLVGISLLVCACTTNKSVIDTSRLVVIELDNNYNVVPRDVWREKNKELLKDKTKQKNILVTLDTYADSIKNILQQLNKNNFPIYNVSCYAPHKKITNGKTNSLHAYASAVCINSKQNPYIDIFNNTIIPSVKDMQDEKRNKDYYLNRNIVRPGMITEKEAKIFYENGFTQWGGSTVWKGNLNYMHFQVSLAIAKIVTSLPKEAAKIFWKKYLEHADLIIMDPFFNQDIDEKDIQLEPLLQRIDNIVARRYNKLKK